MYLERITSPQDVLALTTDELPVLCDEVRSAILTFCARHGGHVGPNLGVCELTVALHHTFSAPEDKIIFDVSHQTYAHKMLTGRQRAFLDPAHEGEASGFSNPRESEYDLFSMGHTSTSVSLACGMAIARDLAHQTYRVVAIIGDGSLSGGLALEGLSNAATIPSQLLIVINDNEQSIAENHGGIYDSLAALRATGGASQNNIFTALGLSYRYLEEGNDVVALCRALEEVRDSTRPMVLHVHTKKGKGFAPAEENPEAWHHVGPFDLRDRTDKAAQASPVPVAKSFAEITGQYLMSAIEHDPAAVVLTAATPYIMGFTPERRARAGRQFVDVGIAEEHAVTCTAALAQAGAHAVFGVYGIFLQRAYDQLWHDVCLNRAPVTILDFGASIFGTTAETHLGFFELSMLSNLPYLMCLCPANAAEYLSMLSWAMEQTERPVVIRVPGLAPALCENFPACDEAEAKVWSCARYQTLRAGADVAILALGDFLGQGAKVADALAQAGVTATLINAHVASELDYATLDELRLTHRVFLTLEDGIVEGGWGQQVASYLANTGATVLVRGISKAKGFPDRYEVGELMREHGIDVDSLAADTLAALPTRRLPSNDADC
ncbi:MAG: 1-deoxy-D-xylulose-5-phosphate synthase [Coriobacteriaceae bacterium]|nr:1-deoxy-D-xylulose-5-phosphate synthase [Coriobacteriaceae bacterium]